MKPTTLAALLCVLLPSARAEAPYAPSQEGSFSGANAVAGAVEETATPRVVEVRIPHYISIIEKEVHHHQVPVVNTHTKEILHPVPVVHHSKAAVHDVHHSVPVVHHSKSVVHDVHHDTHNSIPVLHHSKALVQDVHHDYHHSVPVVHHSVPHQYSHTDAIHHSIPVVQHGVHHSVPVVHHEPVVHHSAPLVHHSAPVVNQWRRK